MHPRIIDISYVWLHSDVLCKQQIESLNEQHNYLEKQLDSLKAASQPRKDEVGRLKDLKKIIAAEEKEIDRLMQGSKQLKEKVCDYSDLYSSNPDCFPYLSSSLCPGASFNFLVMWIMVVKFEYLKSFYLTKNCVSFSVFHFSLGFGASKSHRECWW